MKAKEKNELIRIIQNEVGIVISGLQIINDEHDYKGRIVHGISNQSYPEIVKKIVNDIGKVVMKKIVYEQVLADTWDGRLLKKANTILQELVKVEKPNGGK